MFFNPNLADFKNLMYIVYYFYSLTFYIIITVKLQFLKCIEKTCSNYDIKITLRKLGFNLKIS